MQRALKNLGIGLVFLTLFGCDETTPYPGLDAPNGSAGTTCPCDSNYVMTNFRFAMNGPGACYCFNCQEAVPLADAVQNRKQYYKYCGNPDEWQAAHDCHPAFGCLFQCPNASDTNALVCLDASVADASP